MDMGPIQDPLSSLVGYVNQLKAHLMMQSYFLNLQAMTDQYNKTGVSIY